MAVIKEDFPEIFEELFFNAITNFKKLKYLKLNALSEAKSSTISDDLNTSISILKKSRTNVNRRILNIRKFTLYEESILNRKMFTGCIKLKDIDNFSIPAEKNNYDDFEFHSLNSDPSQDKMSDLMS